MFVFQTTPNPVQKPFQQTRAVELPEVEITAKSGFWSDLFKGMVPIWGTIREIKKAIQAAKDGQKGMMWVYIGSAALSAAADVTLVLGIGVGIKALQAGEKLSVAGGTRVISRFLQKSSTKAIESEAERKTGEAVLNVTANLTKKSTKDMFTDALSLETKDIVIESVETGAKNDIVQSATNNMYDAVSGLRKVTKLKNEAVEGAVNSVKKEPELSAYVKDVVSNAVGKKEKEAALEKATKDFVEPIYKESIEEAAKDGAVQTAQNNAKKAISKAKDAKQIYDEAKLKGQGVSNAKAAAKKAIEKANELIDDARNLLANKTEEIAKVKLSKYAPDEIVETISGSYVKNLQNDLIKIAETGLENLPKNIPTKLSGPLKIVKVTAPVVSKEAESEIPTMGTMILRTVGNVGKITVNTLFHSPTVTRSIFFGVPAESLVYPTMRRGDQKRLIKKEINSLLKDADANYSKDQVKEIIAQAKSTSEKSAGNTDLWSAFDKNNKEFYFQFTALGAGNVRIDVVDGVTYKKRKDEAEKMQNQNTTMPVVMLDGTQLKEDYNSFKNKDYINVKVPVEAFPNPVGIKNDKKSAGYYKVYEKDKPYPVSAHVYIDGKILCVGDAGYKLGEGSPITVLGDKSDDGKYYIIHIAKSRIPTTVPVSFKLEIAPCTSVNQSGVKTTNQINITYQK